MDTEFTPGEFFNLAFTPHGLDKDFLKQWINKYCIISQYATMTPLQWAAWFDNLDIVKYLVENGADITMDNSYPILYASRFSHLDVVKYLLSINICSEEDVHQYAHFACNTNIKELLINYKQFSNTKACKY